MAVPKLLTVGRIAAILQVPVHRVEWVLRTRDIPEKARGGIYRLYDSVDVQRIREELEDIDSRRSGAQDGD